jgi:hypothetical protein
MEEDGSNRSAAGGCVRIWWRMERSLPGDVGRGGCSLRPARRGEATGADSGGGGAPLGTERRLRLHGEFLFYLFLHCKGGGYADGLATVPRRRNFFLEKA